MTRLSLVERVEQAKRPIGAPEEHSGLIFPPVEITVVPLMSWLPSFVAGAVFMLLVAALALTL